MKKTNVAGTGRTCAGVPEVAPVGNGAPADDVPSPDADAGLANAGNGGGPGMRERRDRGDQTDFGAREPGVAADLDGPEGTDGVGGLEGPKGGSDVGPDTWRTREGPDPDLEPSGG